MLLELVFLLLKESYLLYYTGCQCHLRLAMDLKTGMPSCVVHNPAVIH
jgi:hypothetical protein